MRQVEVMGNPKAELFDRGVSRYRAQRALGNEEGDIPSGKVRGGGGGVQHGLLLQGQCSHLRLWGEAGNDGEAWVWEGAVRVK